MSKGKDGNEGFYQLARLAVQGRRIEIEKFLYQYLRSGNERDVAEIRKILSSANPEGPAAKPIDFKFTPVNEDSRENLVRIEQPSGTFHPPVWSETVRDSLLLFLDERRREDELLAAGLFPSRTLLFTGLPGVGKTLAARWIADQLGRPLVVLDLATVMSSFLGRTGQNIRGALNFGKSGPSVFLMDEFDAVASRRDITDDIGELKRLVTVLLQEVDDWPASGILIAATNHPRMLDPAVWRRFDTVIEFPLPGKEEISAFLSALIPEKDESARILIGRLSDILEGISFSDIEVRIKRCRRVSILRSRPLAEELEKMLEGGSK